MSERKAGTFSHEFISIQKQITTTAYIYGVSSGVNNSIAANSLWDTGAMSSFISFQIMRDLKLVPMGTRHVHGVGGLLRVPIVLVTIELPNGILKKDCKIAVADVAPNIDLVIGMDIITLGDFFLLNGQGHTVFSFTTPPRGDA